MEEKKVFRGLYRKTKTVDIFLFVSLLGVYECHGFAFWQTVQRSAFVGREFLNGGQGQRFGQNESRARTRRIGIVDEIRGATQSDVILKVFPDSGKVQYDANVHILKMMKRKLVEFCYKERY